MQATILHHIEPHLVYKISIVERRSLQYCWPAETVRMNFWETIWRRILRRSSYRSLFSLFLKNVFAMCMVYHPPFLGIIFGCVPLDFVDLKNAFQRTRSSENGTLDLLRSLSVPFAFF